MNSKKLKQKIEEKFNSPSDNLILEPLVKRDHLMYKIYYKKTFITILQISMGSHEFGPKLIGLMSRQLGITSSDLKGVVSCTFWGKDFVEKSRHMPTTS